MIQNIKIWFSMVEKSYKSETAYRINIIIKFLGGLLIMYMQVAIWTALYKQDAVVSASLTESVTYMILSSILFSTLELCVGQSIGESVQSGDVGAEMVRPIGLFSQHLAHETGRAFFEFIAYVVPSIIFAVVLFGAFSLPVGVINFLLFVVSSLFGVVIFMLIDTLFGYTAFWLYNNWYAKWVELALLMFFGGKVVPLWFYPTQLDFITKILPFRYISFEPINFYLGRTNSQDTLFIIAMQIFWVAALIGAERFVWHKAQRKIIVQGG